MKETGMLALDNLIYNATVAVKKAMNRFDEVEKDFYETEDKELLIDIAEQLRFRKSDYKKKCDRLLELLSAKKVYQELDAKGIEL